MRISRLIIKNYRNLRDIDIHLNGTVALIGENNSGKSNLLRAVTFPFLPDETGYSGKNLSWIDINDSAKEVYYQYIMENQQGIRDGEITSEEFAENLPVLAVEVHLVPEKEEKYFVKELSFSVDDGEIKYGLRYEYAPSKKENIYKMVQNLFSHETIDKANLNSVKMNLLPTEHYSYSISVPGKGAVSYDILKMYKYLALEAERDDKSVYCPICHQ